MSGTRRRGARDSEVRQKLIEGAREIIQAEGCGAVTAGKLAKKVGLGRHIVHYYFGTIDELFVEVIRREGEEVRRQYGRVLTSDNPLRVIWNPSAAVAPLTFEFIAMAIRKPAIQAEVQRYVKVFRDMFTEAIRLYLERRGIDPNVPPVAIGLAVVSISQALAGDVAIGLLDGHRETEELVEGWISAFEDCGKWPTGHEH